MSYYLDVMNKRVAYFHMCGYHTKSSHALLWDIVTHILVSAERVQEGTMKWAPYVGVWGGWCMCGCVWLTGLPPQLECVCSYLHSWTYTHTSPVGTLYTWVCVWGGVYVRMCVVNIVNPAVDWPPLLHTLTDRD